MAANVHNQLFNESIHDMIKREEKATAKPPRYVSTHASNTGDYYKANKQHNASLGPAKVPLREPKNFLQSHEKAMDLPEKKIFVRCKDGQSKKPPIPTTAPSYGNKSQKKFLVENALEVINSQPKKRGSKEPVYREKADYGRAPAYLSRRAEVSAAEVPETINASPAAPQPGVRMLSQSERMQLLQGLKENWESVNDDYQKLSLTVDTPPKIARKTFLERTLKQLEKDIERMSFTHVFVKN